MGQCRDCAWWTGRPRAWKLHRCTRLSDTLDTPARPRPAALAFGSGLPRAQFVTLRTFGCTEFTPRKES